MTKEEIQNILQKSIAVLEKYHNNSTTKIKKTLEEFKKKTSSQI